MKAAKEKNGENDQNQPFLEMADAARRNYEQAVRTTLKMQEEAGRWWSSMLNQANLPPDWHKRFTSVAGMANSMMPLAQERMEEVMDLMEKNSKTGAELFKKAIEAAQTPAAGESQTKWMDFWTSSMGAVRSNTEAVSQMSSKAIDSWIAFVRKNSEAAEASATRG